MAEQSNIISQVECFEQGFHLTSDHQHYISLVRSPRIDSISKHKKHPHNPVSRSLRAFFQKLRGATTTNHENIHASPVLSTEDTSSYSKPSAVITERSPVTTPLRKPFRVKAYRHTLDLSCTFLDENNDFTLRRASSLKESRHSMNSIYSAFTSSVSSTDSSNHPTAATPDIEENRSDATLQESLWNQDDCVCTKEETAQWLGTNDPTHARVLILYMQNFNFEGQRLDEAFRTLCSKLYFKAESQQLDRIVESFAKRYFECNPNTILQCVDVVYAVAYSLLLLNTDFYIQNWASKMTRQSFVKNTMATIYSLVFPDEELFERRESVSSSHSTPSSPVHSISPPSILGSQSVKSDIESPLSSSLNSSSGVMHVLRSNMSWKHSTPESTLTKSQRHWLTEIENLLKDIYATVKAHRIDQAQITEPMLRRSRTLPKNEQEAHRRRIIRKERRQSVLDTIPVSNAFLSSRRKSVEFSQLPPPPPVMEEDHTLFYKHGLVMRKHVMENNEKRARHRQWQLCYLIMSKTELIMYRPMQQEQQQLQPMTGKARRRRSMMLWNPTVYSNLSIQDIVKQNSDWQADLDMPLTKLSMHHAFASALKPPGWNAQRPHVFKLETADGGHWLFESTDMFAVQAWVEAANMTAAKISKGPLPGAVSNVDYGWGAKWDVCHPAETQVPVWHPPMPCMVTSQLDTIEQYKDILEQINKLNQELDAHRILKLDLDKKYSTNSMQALTNWDKKLQFLLQRLVKLRAYKECLDITL